MGVRIGHASISETGSVNGRKGDQTGREVRVQSWYSHPWTFMAVHKSATVREKHAAAVEAACANDNIGYSQNDRNSLHALAKANGYDLSRVGLCNTDCSALQNLAAVISGSGATYGANGWVTWTMEAELRKLGYAIIRDAKYLKSADFAVRGAILVNASQHTACCLDDGAKADETLKAAGASTSATAAVSTGKDAPKPETARNRDETEKDGVRYVTIAPLNLRVGAGIGKDIILRMPEGAEVVSYGYYNEADGVRWPCVDYYDAAKVRHTGYCSAKYLEKK